MASRCVGTCHTVPLSCITHHIIPRYAAGLSHCPFPSVPDATVPLPLTVASAPFP